MQTNLDKIQFLYQGKYSMEEMKRLPSYRPFHDDICEFLNEYSKLILKDSESKAFPDIITFAFFCRKANIAKLKQKYQKDGVLGRGLTFHIAPSNVPINFAYTLAAGLLAGNSCVVRASSKNFKQTEILCRLMKQTADKLDNPVKDYISVITYERDNEVTDYLSMLCDVRIIWGGDRTVSEIRKSELSSRAFDITFADRYSLCVIKADEILKTENMNAVAQDFYNDTYLYDQNACSSPRTVLWIGEKRQAAEAQEKFWHAVHENIKNRYKVEPVIAVDKMMAEYRCAVDFDGVKLVVGEDNLINRIAIEKLDQRLPEYACAGGCFFEYTDTSIDALAELVTKKYQTLSYYGMDAKELQDWVISKGLPGIDRIVPIGKTADFMLTWDGYNLIDSLSRECVCI